MSLETFWLAEINLGLQMQPYPCNHEPVSHQRFQHGDLIQECDPREKCAKPKALDLVEEPPHLP